MMRGHARWLVEWYVDGSRSIVDNFKCPCGGVHGMDPYIPPLYCKPQTLRQANAMAQAYWNDNLNRYRLL